MSTAKKLKLPWVVANEATMDNSSINNSSAGSHRTTLSSSPSRHQSYKLPVPASPPRTIITTSTGHTLIPPNTSFARAVVMGSSTASFSGAEPFLRHSWTGLRGEHSSSVSNLTRQLQETTPVDEADSASGPSPTELRTRRLVQ